MAPFSFDECYPTAQYTPYFVALSGFISTLFIAFYIFLSGAGIFSTLKWLFTCKCCGKQDLDMDETNQWPVFPEVIEISNPKPFSLQIKTAQEAINIYGLYYLKFDQDSKIPYYQSKFPTSPMNRHYILKFTELKDADYVGWMLFVQEEKQYKYNMMEQTESTESPLNLLNKKYHRYKIYPKNYYSLDRSENNPEFWVQNVKCSDHLYNTFKERNLPTPVTSQYEGMFDDMKSSDWIKIDNIKVYKQKISYGDNIYQYHNTEEIDVNGIYSDKLLSSDDRKLLSHRFGDSYLQNELHPDLKCRFRIKHGSVERGNMLEVSIRHQWLGELVDIVATDAYTELFTSGGDKPDLTKMRTTRYHWEEAVDIVFQIKEAAGFSYYFGQLVQIFLVALLIYQLVYDLVYFISNLVNNDWSGWENYECFCFIVTRSANTKSAVSFMVAMLFTQLVIDGSGGAISGRKHNIIGYVWGTIAIIYCLLMLCPYFTHLMPFLASYCWVWLVPYGFIYCCFLQNPKCFWDATNEDGWDAKEVEATLNFTRFIMVVFIMAVTGYFVAFLVPVEVMSELFDGNSYWSSFYSTLTSRETATYISHHVSTMNKVVNFFVWIF